MAKRKIYRFKGTEGASMPEALVKKWIQQHEVYHEVKAHFFGGEIIQKILHQKGCMGIRIYYAVDNKSHKQLILVGADDKGNDMWPSNSGKGKKLKDNGGNTTADQSAPCPPFCSGPGH